MATDIAFVTTGKTKLNTSSFPYQLYRKAKKLGGWNPEDIDLSADIDAFSEIPENFRRQFLYMIAGFQAGEEAVTLNILPMMSYLATQGRLEEEMYLTTFALEEVKHTEFFHTYLRDVAGVGDVDLHHLLPPSYVKMVGEILPETLWRLQSEPSEKNLMLASIVYNLVVEGVAAMSAYENFRQLLRFNPRHPLPGLQAGLELIRRDESRHIAFGVYLVSRILAEHPEFWSEAEDQMQRMIDLVLQQAAETAAIFDAPDKGRIVAAMRGYVRLQFDRRLDRIRRARGASGSDIAINAEEAEREAA